MVLPRVALAALLVLGLSACESAPEPTMPSVVGKRLDVAISDLNRAGIALKAEVLGGGLFGIQDEANWTVCEQVPATGQPVTEAPRFTVDRTCESASASPTATPTESADSTPTPATIATPTPTAQQMPSTSASPAGPTLTVKNNPELAALLKVSDTCSPEITAFADKYAGQNLEFDANVSNMADFGRNSLYDLLITAGDYSPTSQSGPSFKFADVTMADLNLTGSVTSVSAGDNLHVVAKAGEFSVRNCLFMLEPVSTSVR